MSDEIKKYWFLVGTMISEKVLVGQPQMQSFNAVVDMHPLAWVSIQDKRVILHFFAEVEPEIAKQYSENMKARQNLISRPKVVKS